MTLMPAGAAEPPVPGVHPEEPGTRMKSRILSNAQFHRDPYYL